MKNNKIKKSKTNILLIIAIAVFIFSIINIENSFSSNEKFSLTDVEITNKSDTVEVNGISYEGETITNNIIFHKVGDIVTYKLTVKNNTEKTYTLNSIKNNNENEYITYVFDDYKGIIFNQAEEKSFYITAKYEKELKDISKRDQNFSANFSFNLEDENGEKKDENITINPLNNENNKEKPTKNTSNTENNKNNENNKEFTTKPNTEKNNNSGKKEDTVDKKENKVNEENTKNNIEEIKNNKETIKAISTSPKTGDNVIFYIILSLIAFITIVITLFFNAKSKKNDKNSKKSNKNGKKLLGLILITLIMLPTLSKANNFLLKISMKNTISLQDKLIVNYIINGEEKSKIVKFGEKIEMPEAPKLDGYLFEGWILEDGTEYNLDEEITEDAKIIPKYVPIEYTIIYDLNGGETNNPSKFTVESENIVLNYPVKEGYSFIGWTGTGLDEITKDVTIYKGEIGNKQFVANYEKIEYQISYNLKGGKATNSNKYTIESESITLNNPEKEGYNFTGWTGTGLDEKTMEVIIENGSIGERSYEANYEAINYQITYNGLEDEEKAVLNNPETYTIESQTIEIKNPDDRKDLDGDIIKKFVGWKIGVATAIDTKIETGSTGNKEFTAIWEDVLPNTYIITYSLNNGILQNENPTSFTKYTETFTLNNPSKTGYIFTGWTGSNGEEPEKIVKVQKGTRENLNFTANFKPIEYNISYTLNDGTAENVEKYTIESESFTLNNPSKTGYTFIGWTGTGYDVLSESVIIPSGSYGDKSFEAHFEANKYFIEFNANTGMGNMQNQQLEYDKKENLKENIFSKTGYSFISWNTKQDGTGRDFADEEEVENIATEGTITLYAKWKENYYYVRFNSNGGQGEQMPLEEFCYNEEKSLSKNIYEKENCIFIGWNTKQDGTGIYYEDEKVVKNLTLEKDSVIDLYAMWKTFKVGDYVSYDPESGQGFGLEYKSTTVPDGTEVSGNFKSKDIKRWRVFSISDDGVELIAENPTFQTVTLSGQYGYINGEKILNDISEIYGKGLGAVSGRSICLEDIEQYFKYNKNNFNNYGSSIYYSSGKFIVDDEIVTASQLSPQKVTQTTYWYNIDQNAYYTEAQNELANKIYNMLCVDIPITNYNGNNPKYSPYWLASKSTHIYNNSYCGYGFQYIGDMHSYGTAEMGVRFLCNSQQTLYSANCKVLPIVKLNSNVKFTYDTENEFWNINYTPKYYNVSFNSNGGTGVMQNEEFEIGTRKKLSKNLYENEGYIFNGWNTKANGTGTYYNDEQLVEDLTQNENETFNLYAIWAKLKVGDYVNYNSQSGSGFGLEYDSSNLPDGVSIQNTFKSKDITRWKVYSIKGGKVTLMPEQPTTKTVTFQGNQGYKNCVNVLNDISKIYGKGIGAKEARSISMEDIEGYFKYDKTTFTETDLNHNLTVRYGDTKTYTSGTFLVGDEFVTATTTAAQTVTQTAYWFKMDQYNYSQEESYISNKIYNMLCIDIPVSNGNDAVDYTPYAVADTCVYLRHDCSQNYVRYIGDLNRTGHPELGGVWLSTSIGARGNAELHILPLVTLESSIRFLENNEDNSWNIVNE